MDAVPSHESAVPSWARRVGTAAWVVGPDRTIRFMNRRAESMLGLSAPRVVGRPCHRVIAARDAEDCPFCRPRCPILELFEQGRDAEPVILRFDHPRRRDRWIRVLVVRDEISAAGASLVHLAFDGDRSQPIGELIARAASRPDRPSKRRSRLDESTRRSRRTRTVAGSAQRPR